MNHSGKFANYRTYQTLQRFDAGWRRVTPITHHASMSNFALNTRAREDQADSLADEILDEARGATERNANSKRVLIDALKWRAAKLRPKTYGNKVDHEHGGRDGGPIPIASARMDFTGMTDAEAARRYKAFIDSVA